MRLETSISEYRIDSFRYYHLSQDNNLTVLEPKVPDNFLTRNKYEDSKTPRVSFAPTINQCLMGMSENVDGNEYYVYIPYQIDYNKLVKPHTNQVPDCNITGEVWALQPVRVKCVGKIKAIGDAGLPGHPYTYGDDKIAHLYDWEYKVLVNENEVVGEAALMESLVLFPEDESEILEATAEDIALNNQLEPIFVVNTFTNTDFGRTMQKHTNAQYSHALISLDPYLRHMYSYDDEEVVVNGKTGLSDDYIDRYRSSEGGIMRVILIMVPPKVKQGIQNSINYYLKRADQTKYGYGNLFAWIKGSNKISSWGDLKLFCSEFVDMILKHNNIDITGKSSRNVHPDDLGTFKERSNAYLIYQGLIKNYNGRDMELAIEHLRNTVDHDKLNTITPKSMHARNDIILGKKNHIIPILKSFLPTRTAGTAAHREATAVIGTNGIIEKDSYYPLENISKDDDFELPGDQEYDELQDIQTLLDNADPKRVFLTSDWHFFKNHYKKEANYVNTMKILKWCKENIKDDDIFMYLGDLSFRYASDKDNEMALYYMSQIKGTKIFVLGNHDKMLGAEFFSKSGFDYVVEEIRWHNIIFTHKPINMDVYGDDALNIHGHIHNIRKYNTTDGKKNVNVYPLFYGNKPTTLDYVLNHVEELTKDNEWNPNAGYGESHYYNFHISGCTIKPSDNAKKLAILTEQFESLKDKPIVYFSSDITPENITKMVNFYRYKLNGSVAIKLHFGEEGNKNFLDPSLVKNLTETYAATLVDSNTAYEGSTRGTTEEHLKTAKKHGFDFAPIDILDADGDIELSIPKAKEIEAELEAVDSGKKKSYESKVTNGRHLKSISVGSHIKDYDSMIAYTHFKGHTMAGFGGSIKNIGMGIPSGAKGKMEIHGDDWERGPLFLERLVESASAINDLFEDHVVYVNVLKNLSTECDCDANAPAPTMNDIGVLVSDDLLAIEAASMDFIRVAPKNKDVMTHIADIGGYHQIEYGTYLEIGSLAYTLKDINSNDIKLETALLNEEMINENIILPRSDISYRIAQFSSGEVNKCMVVGFSGSGKTTMGKFLAKALDNCELYELDDLVSNWSFSDANLKEYGDLIYSFFQNPKHKKYRLSRYEELEQYEETEYELPLITDFIAYTNEYTKSHPNIKIVLEGIWCPYFNIAPDGFNDWAVIVKGTSYLTSEIRATNRNLEGQPLIKRIRNFLHNQSPERIKNISIRMIKGVDRWYNYFKKLNKTMITNEAATKRSNLPDSAFGIPEDRKYPLDSEKHVRSAIKLFGHAEESKKKSLAKRIRAAAKKYDIKIPETTQCYKYLTEGAYADIIPENVKNIVFDIGNVLADAHTVDTLLAHPDIPDEYCEEIKDFVYEKFFYGVNQEYKRTVQQFTVEQAKKHYDENAPEHLKPYRDAVFECFGPAMFKYSYDDVLINHFKSKGYHLYYLSNWDRYSYDLETEFFDTLLDDRFDGGLFSFDAGSLLKPDREFFELFLNKYNLDPSDCIFFDDKEENCQAARRLGMYAYTFDKNKTPQMLMGQADIITPPENADDLITVYNSDGTVQNMNISEITWWYVCENRNASNVDEELFYTTLDEAVKYRSTLNTNQDFAVLPLYVFTNAHALKQVQDSVLELVLVGQINLFPTGDYEWEIQYPLRLEGGELSSIKEYAMANTNPVIGIAKPFLIKVGDQNKPDKLPSNLVFAGDIDPDRGLVVNENHQLEVVDLNGVEILEAYQFNGDRYALERLNQYYKNGTRVDNIYSILTNKSMLSEDQIEYDNDFAKVDFDLIEQRFLAEMATNRDKMMEAMNYSLYRNTITEDSDYHKFPSFIYKYNTLGDIYIKEDFDGVYFYSDLTKKRSASVGSTRLLTENMLKAIL